MRPGCAALMAARIRPFCYNVGVLRFRPPLNRKPPGVALPPPGRIGDNPLAMEQIKQTLTAYAQRIAPMVERL